MAAILVGAPAVAQEPRRVTSSPSELLAAFVRQSASVSRASTVASADILSVLMGRSTYSEAERDQLLRGFEELAVSGSDRSLRIQAASDFALAGSQRSAKPVPGIVPRLIRIYYRSPDVRRTVVTWLSQTPDRGEALTFLERIAVQDPADADFPGAAYHALLAMTSMGAEGRGVLQRLHDAGSVRDVDAKNALGVTVSSWHQHENR